MNAWVLKYFSIDNKCKRNEQNKNQVNWTPGLSMWSSNWLLVVSVRELWSSVLCIMRLSYNEWTLIRQYCCYSTTQIFVIPEHTSISTTTKMKTTKDTTILMTHKHTQTHAQTDKHLSLLKEKYKRLLFGKIKIVPILNSRALSFVFLNAIALIWPLRLTGH